METILIYLFKSSVVLTIFYVTYYFLLRKDTFFNINRHFLLIGVIVSLLLPFLEFTTVKFIESPNFYIAESNPSKIINTTQESWDWWLIGGIVYCIGLLLFAIRFVIQLLSLKKLVTGNLTKKRGNYNLIEVTEDIAPFSFFGFIVYNPTLHSKKELNMILEHEKIHVTQYHTIDILIINLLMIFQWINPFVWLYKKSLEQNLEFIADREAINHLQSKKEYQLTLVSVTSKNYAAIANNFYHSLIKKRIVMLNKQTSQNKKLWRIILILPLLSLFLWGFNTKEIVKIQQDHIINSTTLEKASSKKDKEKVVKFMINKNSSKQDFNNIKKTLKNDFNVDIKFSNIERNNNKEITGIKVAITSSGSSTNYAVKDKNPISAFIISYHSKTDSIHIGASESDHNFVMINSKKHGKNKILEIHTDNEDEEHNFTFSGTGKDKIVIIKDKDGKVITEDIHGDSEEIFEIRKKDDNTFAVITGNDGKDPLYFIDGKEATKEKMEKLDSDDIESVNVFKGKNAIKKYGKKAENGVIEIFTKEN